MISILMPAKNAAKYIADTIDSILSQTFKDWELIVVDDHSSDETNSILKSYASQDSRIAYLLNSGVGIADALKMAFDHSKGTYITRMDADDLMTKDKLNLLRTALQEKGRGHVAVGQVEYFSDAPLGDGYVRYAYWLNLLNASDSHYEDIYKECVIPSACWMAHKADIKDIGGIAIGRYPEDYDLCFRMFVFGLIPVSVKHIIHLWRDHSERASRNDPNYLDNSFLQLKADYFQKHTYDASKSSFVWGVGKRGKRFVKYLKEKDLPFTWITNNPKKIGKQIYEHQIKNFKILSDLNHQAQILVFVSNPDEQEEIALILYDWGFEKGKDYWFFV